MVLEAAREDPLPASGQRRDDGVPLVRRVRLAVPREPEPPSAVDSLARLEVEAHGHGVLGYPRRRPPKWPPPPFWWAPSPPVARSSCPPRSCAAGSREVRTSLVTVCRSTVKCCLHPARWYQVSAVQPAGLARM